MVSMSLITALTSSLANKFRPPSITTILSFPPTSSVLWPQEAVSWDTRAHDLFLQSLLAVLLDFYVSLNIMSLAFPVACQPVNNLLVDALGGYRIQNEQPYGVELGLLASVILGGSAFPRALRLRKPVPILLSVISAFGLFTYGSALRRKAWDSCQMMMT